MLKDEGSEPLQRALRQAGARPLLPVHVLAACFRRSSQSAELERMALHLQVDEFARITKARAAT